MKDEIKEILDDLLFTTTLPNVSVKLSKEKLYQLKDYITNLQERCEYLQRSCERKEDEILSLRDECVDGEMYKSRNEKAIELLKEAGCYDEETKTFCDDIWEELPKLLNILNGGDE